MREATRPAPVGDERLLAAAQARLAVLITDAEELIRIESPSDDLDAIARSAQVVARVGHGRLGVEPETLDIDGCHHLRWRFGRGPRRVLLLGHHDTVWPLGTTGRLGIGVDGAVLRGPGCLDMKVGVAMAIHAVALLGAPDGITVLITGDEELGSPTSRDLVRSEARECAAVLVLEAAGPGGALKTARKGRAQYEISIEGRAAHAGLEPERGVNACVELAHQVLAVRDLASPENGTVVTPSLVHGGTTANTVPAAASFSVDVRASTRAELLRVDAALHELAPALPEAQVRVAGGIDRPPLDPSASASLFARARVLAAALGAGELRGIAVGGGSDGNLTADLGVPTLDGLGGVGDGAHAEHEHVRLDAVPGRVALVSALTSAVLHDEAWT